MMAARRRADTQRGTTATSIARTTRPQQGVVVRVAWTAPEQRHLVQRARQQQGGRVQTGVGDDPAELPFRTQIAHERCPSSGMDSGYATLGPIGYETRSEYTTIGTVVNQAARLCAVAEAGQIILTDRMLIEVADLVDAEQVGEFSLKGITQSGVGFSILATKQATGEGGRSRTRGRKTR